MSRYAEKTSVPSDRSRAEIERTLIRYGADQFAYGWETGKSTIDFRAADRYVRFELPMPDRSDYDRTPTGRQRSTGQVDAEYEQAARQRWRALALVVKAKLEAVEAGITTFEDEFMAHLILPNGSTVGEWMRPQLQLTYADGAMPPLLSAGRDE